MYIDFSQLFHQASKDRSCGGVVRVPANPKEWPHEWKTVEYKAYPRFECISLPDTKPPGMLADAIEQRRSEYRFSGASPSREMLGALLKYSCGIVRGGTPVGHRAQPSGGARYPIEVYPLIFRGSDKVPAGVYHYDVKNHGLTVLWQKEFSVKDINAIFSYPWVEKASFALVLTGVFGRVSDKYGSRGYRYALVEAGHIGQNIYLNATALGISCCALGGTWDTAIEKLLAVDGVSESLVYALALG